MRGSKYTPSSSTSDAYYSKIFSNETSEDGAAGSSIPNVALKLLGTLALGNAEMLQNRLRIYSLLQLATSSFFWLWAIYNTIQLRSNDSGGFDMGIFSFFGSGFSSLLLLRSSLGGRCYDTNQRFGCCGNKRREGNNNDNDEEVDVYGIRKSSSRNNRGEGDNNDAQNPIKHSPPGKCIRSFLGLTQIIVVANYILGILFALTAGEHVYVYFATYCCTFAFLWLIAAFVGYALVGVYRDAVGRQYGKEVLNPPRPSCVRAILRSLLAMAGGATTAGGYGAQGRDYYPDQEEEDEIDDELRALYEGRGGYTNADIASN